MAATAAGFNITGTESGEMYGDSELLENLIDEANRSLEKLAAVGLQVDQVWVKNSVEVKNAQSDTLVSLLPEEEMEGIRRRVRTLEGLLLDAHR